MLKWVQACSHLPVRTRAHCLSSRSLGFPSHSASLHFIDCISLNMPIYQNLKHWKKPFFIQTFKASQASLLITLHWLAPPALAHLLLIFRVSLKGQMCPEGYPHSMQPLFISLFRELSHRGIAGVSKLLQSALNTTSGGCGISHRITDLAGSAERDDTLLGSLSLPGRLQANKHIQLSGDQTGQPTCASSWELCEFWVTLTFFEGKDRNKVIL